VMPKFVFDTNHLSHAIRKVSPLRDRLRAAVRSGHQLGTCWPVLCELQVGIRQTAKPDEVRQTLRTILKDIRIWPMNWHIVNAYADFRLLAKSKGISISHVDLVLASFAQTIDAILLTTDNDFRDLKTLHTENWTTCP
jgi:predicted nucleic acid-binding protein